MASFRSIALNDARNGCCRNFYGKVVVEPTVVEHTTGGLRAMTQVFAVACREEGLTDTIVAVEMTGIYGQSRSRERSARQVKCGFSNAYD